MNLFYDNKYTVWYYNIVHKANQRTSTDEQCETHHIIPKSLGGPNNEDNLVRFTLKEHYVAHLLLTKMCKDSKHKGKMIFAARVMCDCGKYGQRRTGRLYENIKIQKRILWSQRMKEDNPSTRPGVREKISLTQRNKKLKAWNKGVHNPNAAAHGKHGDEKQRQLATGRKRHYEEDGSWIWIYPRENDRWVRRERCSKWSRKWKEVDVLSPPLS